MTVHHGDCRAILATFADASIDSIVTDPPYELSQGSKASAARVMAEVMFPQNPKVVAEASDSDCLAFLVGKITELSSVCSNPGESTAMPVGPMTLDHELPGWYDDVTDTDEPSVCASQRNGGEETDAEGAEHLGCFALELADMESAVDALNRSGACFLSGGLGVGLTVSPASLPSLLRRSTTVVVADNVVRAFDDALSSLIGAGTRAEELSMPRPFHLSRGLEHDCTTGSALVLLGVASLSGAKLIRARPRASRLSSVTQSHRVRVVDETTHRTLSFDLLLHDVDPTGVGFMGKAWDGSKVAYDVGLWSECLRVLKPGGHLLAFGGTRTYHRMAVAIEDAGFEVRDSIHWLYGSGFPKSLDVSKAIDKAASAEREVVGDKLHLPGYHLSGHNGGEAFGHGLSSSTPETRLKAAQITAPATDAARQWEGWGTALKPAHEPIVVARKPLIGTVAANVLHHGTGAINVDGGRVGTTVETWPKSRAWGAGYVPGGDRSADRTEPTGNVPPGRWPANIVFTHAADCSDQCAEGCPVAALDEQSGVSRSVRAERGSGKGETGIYGAWGTVEDTTRGHTDSGGASRFFTVTEWDVPFRYIAKPSKRERNAGLDGIPTVVAGSMAGGAETRPNKGDTRTPRQNHHPTVKPLALMRWLVRLVTPPGGTVLDPFLGSGTTAAAAVLEGFDWVGCEMTAEYLPIIEGRVAWAHEQAGSTTREATDDTTGDVEQMRMFG